MDQEIPDRPEQMAADEISLAETALDKDRKQAVQHLTKAVELLVGEPPHKSLPSQNAEEAIDLLARISSLGEGRAPERQTIRHELLDLVVVLRRSAMRAPWVPLVLDNNPPVDSEQDRVSTP